MRKRLSSWVCGGRCLYIYICVCMMMMMMGPLGGVLMGMTVEMPVWRRGRWKKGNTERQLRAPITSI